MGKGGFRTAGFVLGVVYITGNTKFLWLLLLAMEVEYLPLTTEIVANMIEEVKAERKKRAERVAEEAMETGTELALERKNELE